MLLIWYGSKFCHVGMGYTDISLIISMDESNTIVSAYTMHRHSNITALTHRYDKYRCPQREDWSIVTPTPTPLTPPPTIDRRRGYCFWSCPSISLASVCTNIHPTLSGI